MQRDRRACHYVHAAIENGKPSGELKAPGGVFIRFSWPIGSWHPVFMALVVLAIHLGTAVEMHAQSSSGSYVAAFRTPKHVMTSKPDVFHSAVEEVVRFLESKNVDLVSDPIRPRIETEDPISIESLVKIAKDAGASYLLYIVIDRPISQWLKVTVQCYDIDGKMLWQESAGYTGSFDVNSKKALPEIMKKLGKQFAARFDHPGLMLKRGSPSSPSVEGGNPQQ